MLSGSLQQLCACGHPHVRDNSWSVLREGQVPLCPECGCGDFQLHPGIVAAAERRHAADRELYGGNAILPPDLVEGLLQVLAHFENGHEQRYGWDCLPMLGVVSVGTPQRTGQVQRDLAAPLSVMAIEVHPLRLDETFWATCDGNASHILSSLSRVCQDNPSMFDSFRFLCGLDPDAPVVGWFSLIEAYMVNNDTGERVDEMRSLCMVDLDERVYTVQRARSTGETREVIDSLKDQAAYIDACREAGQPVHPEQQIPLIPDAMLRLTRLSRMQAQVADAVRNVE